MHDACDVQTLSSVWKSFIIKGNLHLATGCKLFVILNRLVHEY